MVATATRKLTLLGAAVVLVTQTGCLHGWAGNGNKSSTGTIFTKSAKNQPPATAPTAQVVTTWNNQVVFAADPMRGGQENPGLTGRVYLFGPEISTPHPGDGTIIVDLFDVTSKGPTGQPVHLERWEFDKETLKKFLKQDLFGWGYTLFLPWGTYKPDFQRVNLSVTYTPSNGQGTSVTAPITALSVDHSATLDKVRAMQTTKSQGDSAVAPVPLPNLQPAPLR